MEKRWIRKQGSSGAPSDGDTIGRYPVGDTGREFFVGNLCREAREPDLRHALRKFGEIEGLRIAFKGATGQSRGFAYVTFVQPVSLNLLQGTDCMGRRLHIERDRYAPENNTKPPRQSPSIDRFPWKTPRDGSRGFPQRFEFFVGGLPCEANDEDLRAAFDSFGEILKINIVRDGDSGRSRGFGFITVEAAANLQAEDFADTTVLDKRVRVERKTDRAGRMVPTLQPAMVSTPISAQKAEAETARPEWVEMTAPKGDGSAALVCYGEQSEAIKKHFEKRQLADAAPWHGGNIGPVIADQLASNSGLIASGLQAGKMFQVIGTPHLVEGLKTGTYALMQTAEGTLGTVVSSSGGKVAGQLRFAQASMAPVLAPVLAWQVLHAIAGTSQLRKINRRLDGIQRKLETIGARNEAGVLGEVLNAVRTLEDICSEHTNTGTFNRDMETRLALVEQTIGSIFERNRSLVDLFGNKTSEVHRLGGKTGAVRATSLMREEGGQAVHDMEMLFGLAAAQLRVLEARMHHALEHQPADLERRFNEATKVTDNYCELLGNLPSVESLESHAQACVEEMRWFQRKVFFRGVGKEAAGLSTLGLRDPKLPVRSGENSTEGSYVFWKDEAGGTKIYMLPNGDYHG